MSDSRLIPATGSNYHLPLATLSKEKSYSVLPQDSPGVSKTEFISGEENADYPLPSPSRSEYARHAWIPIALREWFILPWIVLNAVGAVAIELLWYFNSKSFGWGVISQDAAFSSAHFIYTIPPAAVAVVFTSGWGMIDNALKQLQPFVSLSRGGATPNESILLDYNSYIKFIQWLPALQHRHRAVFLSSMIALTVLVAQPLASGFFVVRNTQFPYWVTVDSYGDVGLDPDFETLTPFVTAAGYAEAAALYQLPSPPFTKEGWTVGEFDYPNNLNGTISVNTTAFLSSAQCDPPDSISLVPDQSGYVLNATWGLCSNVINIDTTAKTQYGVNVVAGCTLADVRPDMYKPVAFWIFDTSGSQPLSSMTFCDPILQIFAVEATINLGTGLLLDATVNGQYIQSNNVTSDPLNLRAMNGISFNLTNPDQYVLARANATQSGLPSAIYQAASESDTGLEGTFALGPSGFQNLTSTVYTLYLSLIAKEVYFLESQAVSPALLVQDVQRLYITPYAAHALAVVLLVSSIIGLILNFVHKRERRNLRLPVPIGTIGVTASMSRELERLLHGVENTEHMNVTLRGRRFRLDHRGIIVIEDDGPAF